MFNHSEGRATCSVQRATCSLTGIDQWGLRHCFQLLGLAFVRIGFRRPSLCLADLVFSIRSVCHWISIVFLLYGRRIATHSVNPALTHFLGEFTGLGLDLIPNVVVPEADQRYTWSRKLDPNF